MRHVHLKLSTHIAVALSAFAVAVTGVFAYASNIMAETSYRPSFAAVTTVDGTHVAATSGDSAIAGVEVTTVQRFAPPISFPTRRVTKKPFGIEIHPETSPVPNDHFNGFHVGVDFETDADEADVDVPVYAICRGKLLYSTHAKGYGGVAVQGCVIDGQEVSVIYGHLNQASVLVSAGEMIEPGQKIGNLGKGYSEETDGVRKHLHLGIRKGRTSDIRGYVPAKEDTEFYMNALQVLSLR